MYTVEMHESSYRTIGELLTKIVAENQHGEGELLDVGSYDVNGTYRPIVESLGLSYFGTDMTAGPNVDRVVSAYDLVSLGREFDIVLSGQALEHMETPWIAVEQMRRVLKPGGWLVLTAPASWPYHPYPLDCWRIRIGGMEGLLKGLESVQVWEHTVEPDRLVDCYGIGRIPRKCEMLTN